MPEAHDTRSARRRALAAERAADFFPLNDLPNDLLVSVFAAAEDPTWVRHTFPLVCRAWNELYLSKDASPLHETLEVDFGREVWAALAAAREGGGRRDPVEGPPRRPVVHASRVIAWAQERAGSVRKLRLTGNGIFKDFTAEDLGALVAVVGSSLTEISIGPFLGKLCERPFWESLRDSVVPAGRLRSLVLEGNPIDSLHADLLGQLPGSLEELELSSTGRGPESGLSRFPESLCSLAELRCLDLSLYPQITAIPAEISFLKNLEELKLNHCRLSSLPEELGALSGLTKLDLSGNRNLGTTLLSAEAFPAELGGMKSLRELNLESCRLRTVPAFVGELESLETLDLSDNDDLQIDAPLDFLIEGCPRLREVKLKKGVLGRVFTLWTPESRAHLEAFEAKLRAKNPSAELEY